MSASASANTEDTEDTENTDDTGNGLWDSLTAAPQTWLSRPVMINDTAFITASDKTDPMKNESGGGVLLYDTVTDEWSMYFRYPDDVRLVIDYPTIHLDRDNQTLYVHSDGGTLLIIDTVTKSFEIRAILQAGSYAHCITLHDQFHLLLGFDSNKHLIFEDVHSESESLMAPKTFHEITDFEVCEGAGFVHCELRRMLFLFGGYDKHERYRGVSMEPYKVWCWEYETENGWSHYKNMRMPGHLRQFGFAVTADERFIIMSGGRNLTTGVNQKVIYIMDIDEGVIREIDVECPATSVWHSIIVPQNPMDRLLINGYLRNSKFPQELIKVVLSWYSCEQMHLLKDNEHYRISTKVLQ